MYMYVYIANRNTLHVGAVNTYELLAWWLSRVSKMPPVLWSSGTLGFEAFSLLGVLERAEICPPTDSEAPLRLTAEVTRADGARDLGVVLECPPLSIPSSEMVCK